MSEQKKDTGLGLAVAVTVAILIAVVIWAVVKQKPTAQSGTVHSQQHDESAPEHHHIHPVDEHSVRAADDVVPAKMSLSDVVRAAKYWAPTYQTWLGKTSPDFVLTDITGKEHRLSDYRGKDVMLVFWATWCRPCLMEIPHLIELRNTTSQDKLAMLAVSYEEPALVKRFAARQKLNYTVFAANVRTLPVPFNTIYTIPCSFFIEPDGKIKLTTTGLLTLGDIKAILQAE